MIDAAQMREGPKDAAMRQSDDARAAAGTSDTLSATARADCRALGMALKGDIGEAVEAVQNLILTYYDDVRAQATESFRTARRVALSGFVVVALTIGYLIVVDLGRRMQWFSNSGEIAGGMSIGTFGLIGGAIVEFLAAAQFLMQTRTAKQFGAFHICLERTHRYLLAYKIADSIHTDKDKTLERIACLMANAPMITREDIEGLARSPVRASTGQLPASVAG
jgi:hypothetical protein